MENMKKGKCKGPKHKSNYACIENFNVVEHKSITCLKIKCKGLDSVGQQMAILELVNYATETWNQKTKLVSVGLLVQKNK